MQRVRPDELQPDQFAEELLEVIADTEITVEEVVCELETKKKGEPLSLREFAKWVLEEQERRERIGIVDGVAEGNG